MKTVEKKILPQFFKAVVQGMKTFEYRKDDDNIQEGDIIKLSEIDADTKEKTGRWIVFGVGTVLRHKDWGDIPEGFCVISLVPFVNQNLTSWIVGIRPERSLGTTNEDVQEMVERSAQEEAVRNSKG